MSVDELNPQSMNCLVCGSNKLRKFKAHAFDADKSVKVNITECKTCCFAWQHPRERTQSESIAWFKDAYSDAQSATTKYFDDQRKKQIATLELQFVNSLITAGKTLLDIGAGSGTFAKLAQEDGWDVTAIDPAIDEAQFVENPGIKVLKGEIDSLPNEIKYDIITLWDVIEHTEMPLKLISQAKSLLKKEGWLVVETGNYKSIDRVSRGLEHWIYQLDHRWYFSPESIKKIFSDCGFQNAILCDRVLRPNWKGSLNYLGPSRKGFILEVLKTPKNIFRYSYKYFMSKRVANWDNAGLAIFTMAAQAGDGNFTAIAKE